MKNYPESQNNNAKKLSNEENKKLLKERINLNTNKYLSSMLHVTEVNQKTLKLRLSGIETTCISAQSYNEILSSLSLKIQKLLEGQAFQAEKIRKIIETERSSIIQQIRGKNQKQDLHTSFEIRKPSPAKESHGFAKKFPVNYLNDEGPIAKPKQMKIPSQTKKV